MRLPVLALLVCVCAVCLLLLFDAAAHMDSRDVPRSPAAIFMEIGTRTDRYGSNALCWMYALAISRIHGMIPIHNCCARCRLNRFLDKALHSALIRYSSTRSLLCDCEEFPLQMYEGHVFLVTAHYKYDMGSEPPLESIMKSGVARDFFSVLQEHVQGRAQPTGFQRDENSEMYVAIHQRFEDVRHRDVDHAQQSPFSLKTLAALVRASSAALGRRLQPRRHGAIVIVSDASSMTEVNEMCCDLRSEAAFPLRPVSHADIDEALLYMARADILVCGKSNFSLTAAICRFGDPDRPHEHVLDSTFQGSASFPFSHAEDLVGRGKLSARCGPSAYMPPLVP